MCVGLEVGGVGGCSGVCLSLLCGVVFVLKWR